jgi:hypothetical protein
MTIHKTLIVVLLVCACAQSAGAQNWTFDARKIALGNAGGGADNLASRMIDEAVEYRAIVLPFGLFQVLRDLDIFRPGSEKFDIIRSVEYAAAPLHYVIGRDSRSSEIGQQFVVDVRNGRLSRDLNTYRGFAPVNQPVWEGLTYLPYGGTIRLYRGGGGTYQGIFVGAGPYFAMRTAVDLDERLLDILDSDTNVYVPNTQFTLGTASRGQLALALTGGYRGRFAALTVGGSDRDGVYVAANYNYLVGFDYENTVVRLRLDTDNGGLLTINPTLLFDPPLRVTREHTHSGRGFAIDAGIGIIAGPIEAGFGVNGIANRIEWNDVERSPFSLSAVFLGSSDFFEGPTEQIGDVRVELPQDVRGHFGYRAASWRALAEVAHGFQGASFNAGYERSLGSIDLRGGALYVRELWHPTGGIGLNISRRVSLDVAMFGTAANIERKRKAAIAVSLRVNAES